MKIIQLVIIVALGGLCLEYNQHHPLSGRGRGQGPGASHRQAQAGYSQAQAGYAVDLGPEHGRMLDEHNGVPVYYNGDPGNTSGPHLTADNYDLGLKYQCVEFVKRYYYQYYHHKMPDSYGDAKDFLDPSVPDGGMNFNRGLQQHTNPSRSKPQEDDLLVFASTPDSPYGHVAIVTRVWEDGIELIQQNPGIHGHTRVNYALVRNQAGWRIDHDCLAGWLRLASQRRL